MVKTSKYTGSTAKTKDGYKVVGQARDGVWIIKPSVRPTHFSQAEAAASVKKIWRDFQSGQIVGAKSK
jgi:hypothetical protein